jgi:hypothetical protein
MFMMITQRCLKNEPVINRLNAGLEKAGICKQLSKVAGVTGVHTYEKLTFEGHQALKLLAEEGGKMAVTNILESMWPTGDADGEGGAKYVPRVTALWAQWRKVVDLMKERDPAKVAQVDGFERFGKECREFCRLYQAMYHEQHCRSFYLHVLMHHAGDFMRELATEGMCLGMMSNSGVERRHEYGRRAAKKAMTGACWRKTSSALAGKANLFAYLTLKEVLIWQCGTDIVSHSIALKASQQPDSEPRKGGRAADSGETDRDHEAEAYLAETLDEAKRALEVAEMSDEPASTTEAPEDGTELEGIERNSELFIGRDDLCGVLEQESVAGSDEFEDEDAEVMARRIKDLEDLRGDWLPEQDDEDGDFVGRTDDEDSDPDDVTWVKPGPRRKPDLPIALSRGRRTPGRAGPTRTRVRDATSVLAGPEQQQQAAASVPADSGQPQPQGVAASDPPGPRPGVPRESASPWTWKWLNKLTIQQLKNLCQENGIAFNNRAKKEPLMTLLLQHRPAA